MCVNSSKNIQEADNDLHVDWDPLLPSISLFHTAVFFDMDNNRVLFEESSRPTKISNPGKSFQVKSQKIVGLVVLKHIVKGLAQLI